MMYATTNATRRPADSIRRRLGRPSFALEPGDLPDECPVSQDAAKLALLDDREHRRRWMDEGSKLRAESTGEEVRSRDAQA